MTIICLSCGHRQERKLHAKGRPRCSVCHSRRFSALNGRGDLMKVKLGQSDSTFKERKRVVTKEEEKREWQSLGEKVGITTDNRRIGTMADIGMPSLANPEVKKEHEYKEGKGEERERWRKNELLHAQGRREQIGFLREATEFIGSMVSEKNPRGHGSKAMNHAFRIAEIMRQIRDEGGDIRLLGENTRKLMGDNDSLFGFGVVRSGRGGILGRFRRKK